MTPNNPDTLYFRVIGQVADWETKRLSSIVYYQLYSKDAKSYSNPQVNKRSENEIELLCHLGDKVRIDPKHGNKNQHFYFEENILEVVESAGWYLISGGTILRKGN